MSEIAKKAAGTFVPDDIFTLPETLAWATQECRTGSLKEPVRKFCAVQEEILDQSVVIVESVATDCIHCRIPCRCSDHETAEAFDFDVRFVLDPKSGECRRV
jgi:hypothetical protein